VAFVLLAADANALVIALVSVGAGITVLAWAALRQHLRLVTLADDRIAHLVAAIIQLGVVALLDLSSYAHPLKTRIPIRAEAAVFALETVCRCLVLTAILWIAGVRSASIPIIALEVLLAEAYPFRVAIVPRGASVPVVALVPRQRDVLTLTIRCTDVLGAVVLVIALCVARAILAAYVRVCPNLKGSPVRLSVRGPSRSTVRARTENEWQE